MATPNDMQARLKEIEKIVSLIPKKIGPWEQYGDFGEEQVDRSFTKGQIEIANAIRKILHAPVPGGDAEKALIAQREEDEVNAMREATAHEVYGG